MNVNVWDVHVDIENLVRGLVRNKLDLAKIFNADEPRVASSADAAARSRRNAGSARKPL
jgi:hypothetical protein